MAEQESMVYKCPSCSNDIRANLSEGVTAVFCQYCKCRVDVGL
ncbi:MAG: hypothetical protein Q7J54_05295 [Candidatus Woesearchaeota archaeon]|nr:hypothetical protein [Candidatus Woesearchaeota archaeon]